MNNPTVKSNQESRILVTGAAGFIGSLLVEKMLSMGRSVVGIDNLSNGTLTNLESARQSPNFVFHEMDCTDIDALVTAMRGIEEVWHLAANTDIISAHKNPKRDFRDCVEATFCVLEAMKLHRVPRIIFASTGSVYGAMSYANEVTESSGPLKPLSTYGAGKLASEAFISSYSNLYDIESYIFRFGNVIGGRISHGVIFDFVRKLSKNGDRLLVLGNGTQTKNYFLAKDCIDGMLHLSSRNLPERCEIINLGAQDLTNVLRIAEIVISEMKLQDTVIEIEGTEYAWPGDQPIVRLNCDKAASLGWRCNTSSDEAVRLATREIIDSYRSTLS